MPGVLSFLGHHDVNAEVNGLKDIPKDERPPVLPVFLSFRTMVALGTFFILLTIVGMFKRNRLLEAPVTCGSCFFPFPCPTWPSKWDGCWPKWAASPGSSMA